jgi:hypothetical protein
MLKNQTGGGKVLEWNTVTRDSNCKPAVLKTLMNLRFCYMSGISGYVSKY